MNERIKAEYIPSYIFENEGNIYFRSFFKKRKLSKLKEFPEKLRCSNINGVMHKLLVGECQTGANRILLSVLHRILLSVLHRVLLSVLQPILSSVLRCIVSPVLRRIVSSVLRRIVSPVLRRIVSPVLHRILSSFVR